MKKSIPVLALFAGLAWFFANNPPPGSKPTEPVNFQAAENRAPDQAALFSPPQPDSEKPAIHLVPDDSHDLQAAELEAESLQVSKTEIKSESPEGDGAFFIFGIVVDEAGYGIPGMEVTAFAKKLFPVSGDGETRAKSPERSTLSGPGGFYEFRGIEDGEYRVSTQPDDYYEAAQAVVRAGADTADLVLRERRPEAGVFGTVRGDDGEPLDGVEVLAVGQSDGAAHTDADGFYELTLEVSRSKPAYTLQFVREGYREKRPVIELQEMEKRGKIRVDTEMEPVQELVEVSATVHNRKGEPVPGESVQLYSPAARQRYTAVSDSNGEVWFEEVETSADYSLSVHPADSYRDFVIHDVEITLAGANLEVVLEPMNLGSLAGQMVDSTGQPVPEFSLWLRNPDAINQPAMLVTGDQQGFFEVNGIEEGNLIFETRSSPRYSISGIHLSAKEELEVLLVLDWGNHQVWGLVVDDTGRPVTASELFATSFRRYNGVRAQAVHEAITDEAGRFLFTRVGPGNHTIRIDVPGYRTTILHHDVGRDAPEVIIRLERASSHGM